MSRRDKPSNLPPPFSSRVRERYNDTESEAEPADDGDDPLESDVDRVRHTRDRDVRDTREVRDRRDPRREVDVDRPRRDPPVPSSARRPRDENEFSDDDPRRGLSLPSKRFLDLNVADPGFLGKSAEYLKLHRILSSQSVSEWRERAQCAVRGGDGLLARRLIQQAELIRIWQKKDGTIGDLSRGEDSDEFSSEFFSFIQKTYQRYLTYLAEAEAEDQSLRRKRGDMLQPWATFVQQVSGEDIMRTFSLSPNSDPSTWIFRRTKRPEVHPDPVGRSRNRSDPTKLRSKSRKYAGDDDDDDDADDEPIDYPRSSGTHKPYSLFSEDEGEPVDYPPYGGTYGPSGTSPLPYRRPPPGDGDRTVTRAPVPSQPIRGSDPRYQRKDTDPREGDRTQRKSVVVSSSQTGSRATGYMTYQPKKTQRDTYAVLNEDPQEEEEEQAPSKRTDPDYPHRKGRVDPKAEPRTWPVPGETVKTRPPQDRGTPTKSLSPTSTVETAPAVRPRDISELLRGFINQQSYQDCCNFCKSNKRIFDEDWKSLQGLAQDYLRQGRRDGAMYVIERWLMLRRALESPEDRFEWMEELPTSERRQGQLQRECRLALELMEGALKSASTSSVQTSGVAVPRRGGPDNNRRDPPRPDRTDRQDRPDRTDRQDRQDRTDRPPQGGLLVQRR